MRYKALSKDSEIDPEVALLQSISALDAAGVKAQLMSDVDGLLNVAAGWMKISEVIQAFAEKAEEVIENARVEETKIEMGFQAARPEVEPITVEEDEDGGIEDTE